MYNKLQFNEDHRFKIIQFTDTHWESEDDSLDEIDLKTEALITKLLNEENPDLVVFTGDIISGLPNASNLNQRAIAPVSRLGIPYAVVSGNHDVDGIISNEELVKLQLGSTSCLINAGENGGTGISDAGDYVLEVQSSCGNKTSWNLYMLNSGNRPADPKYGTDAWIQRSQIDWYIRKSSEMNKVNEEATPALAFFHIPLPEFNDVWELGKCIGSKEEAVCCPSLNSGFFSAMVEMGEIKGVFVGHDHYNDYCGSLHGIWLCYGRATGYRTHKKDKFAYGARIIQMQEDDPGFETWLRLNDGSKINHVNCLF